MVIRPKAITPSTAGIPIATKFCCSGRAMPTSTPITIGARMAPTRPTPSMSPNYAQARIYRRALAYRCLALENSRNICGPKNINRSVE